MRIVVASGKGGTGKTTVSTNLARVLARTLRVQYVDCDVEEPNGHLFLHPVISEREDVKALVPEVDETKCTHCGKCSELCRFHAISSLPTLTLTFPELCHGCGGCALVCPTGAISEVGRTIGVIESASSDGIAFVHGRLNVGEAMSPPLIRRVLAESKPDMLIIIDAPPGTSCPAVTALRRADRVVMVAEPTAFGLHDLSLALEGVEEMSLPYGVFINQCDIGDDRVERFCAERQIPIWGRLKYDRRVAEAYSRGELAVDAVPEVGTTFLQLADTLLQGTTI
jgi:MinD superfamily P-loop ATPase